MKNSQESLITTNGVGVSDKILAVRSKIEDTSYINNAVLLIASVLSKKLVEQPKAY